MSNWMEMLANPRGHVLKKAMFEILKEKYGKHQDIIERLGHYLVTENDITSFHKMIVDVFEIAYLKAVNDHKEQLSKMGLQVKVVADPDFHK